MIKRRLLIRRKKWTPKKRPVSATEDPLEIPDFLKRPIKQTFRKRDKTGSFVYHTPTTHWYWPDRSRRIVPNIELPRTTKDKLEPKTWADEIDIMFRMMTVKEGLPIDAIVRRTMWNRKGVPETLQFLSEFYRGTLHYDQETDSFRFIPRMRFRPKAKVIKHGRDETPRSIWDRLRQKRPKHRFRKRKVTRYQFRKR